MSTITLAILALLVGYFAGRVHGVGRHHEKAMAHWRAHIIGAALYPPKKLLELSAEK